jgi:primosomal protein N' (replication factor Y)
MRVPAGARVLVPFRGQRIVGIVTELHDHEPKVNAKKIIHLLDNEDSPALSEELLRLGRWISEYYLAPLGEVFRTMLPLNAEFRRVVVYRIADEGYMALHLAGSTGSPGRSRRSTEEQDAEFRVLNYLSARDQAREAALKSATGASRELLTGMVRKKWIVREDIAA